MIIVSDTSPLGYLIRIDHIHLLSHLFSSGITIPRAVWNELSDPESPAVIRSWIESPPAWLRIQAVEKAQEEAELHRLHRGERAAILLAEQTGADLLLVDDKEARKVARDRGLPITGLIGILDVAAEDQLIDLPATVKKLEATSFRANPSLLKWLLHRHT
jgi:predicted nucleic acid-binding protein